MKPAPKRRMLDADGACELLGVSRETLANLRETKRIPCHRYNARLIRYDEADLLGFIDRAKLNAFRATARLALLLLFVAPGLASSATVTAYCPCAICCGVMGGTSLTASGVKARQGVTAAASRALPFGTRLLIPGVGERVVQDRLADRFNDRVDVFFRSHADAVAFGRREIAVRILPAPPTTAPPRVGLPPGAPSRGPARATLSQTNQRRKAS
jgi:3D (Asp-Asp-Asp) domain-containing protein